MDCLVCSYLYHHCPPPPSQSPKNSGLQEPARSSLLCLYLEKTEIWGEMWKIDRRALGLQGAGKWEEERASRKDMKYCLPVDSWRGQAGYWPEQARTWPPRERGLLGSQSQLFEDRIIKEGWQQE